MLSNLLSRWFNNCSIFNQHCLLCAAYQARDGWCAACLNDLVRMPACCPRCARPLPEATICGHCQLYPPHFDAVHVPYVFCYPLNQLIYAFKYRHHLEYSHALEALFVQANEVIAPSFDCIVAVPLARERLAERGFNQSDELARGLAGPRTQRLDFSLCWRKRNTLPQASLSPAERKKNLRDAFAVKRRVDGLSIAIVDDVMTTGTTLNALAGCLKKNGASRVEAWTLARAIPQKT